MVYKFVSINLFLSGILLLKETNFKYRRFICIALIIIWLPIQLYGWGSENHPFKPEQSTAPYYKAPYSAHYFIINKAIEYLRKKELLSDWPLERYSQYINYGAYWADFPYYPMGLVCNWADYYEGTCEGLHHYYSSNCIRLTDVGGACIGFTGGLSVPEYAQTLYNLGIKFWPEGATVPDIHDLTFLQSGGYATTILDGEDLGPFVVGGHPFIFKRLCLDIEQNCPVGDWCFCPREDAYRWPGFLEEQWTEAIPSESVKSSLIYLGWAIHLIEDVSTPVHAQNETGTYHAEFEARADELIMNGKMSNLPVDPNGDYSFVSTIYNDYPVISDYFYGDWSIVQYATEAHQQAINAKTPPWSDGSWGMTMDQQIEIDLDASIKLVAAILYKFFTELELPKDYFESNDLPSTAKQIVAGTYNNLTLHAALDYDFYSMVINEDYNDVRLFVKYNTTGPQLSVNIKYKVEQDGNIFWLPGNYKQSESGIIFEDNQVPNGREYIIEIDPFDELPLYYSIELFIGAGELPPDRFEINNSTDNATYLSGSTTETNIHNNEDIDFFKIDAPGYSVKAEITFCTSHGNLELFLDDAQATEGILSNDGSVKKISITGCGKSPSFIKVSGVRNFYEISITKILLQEGCEGYNPLIPLNGSGTFIYSGPICQPGQQPPQDTAIARNQMYFHKASESDLEVLWSTGIWLDLTSESYLPLILEIHCPKGIDYGDALITAKILSPNLNNIVWTGSTLGKFYLNTSTDNIAGFSAVIQLISIKPVYCAEPGHGTLNIMGSNAPFSVPGGPYTGKVGTAVSFDAGNSIDMGQSIILYEWDWNNDGIYDESSAMPEINHIWDLPYSGLITLKVTNNGGFTGVNATLANIRLVLPACGIIQDNFGCYNFNGNISDGSGYGNDGVWHGGSQNFTTDKFGIPNNALSFDGLDDYVSISDANSFDLKEFTISAIIKVSNYNKDNWILNKGMYFGNFSIIINSNEKIWPGYLKYVHQTEKGNWSSLASNGPFPLDEFVHIVIMVDSNGLRTYINGILQEVYTLNAPVPIFNNEPVTIGAGGYYDLSELFTGVIDEVKIYNRVLTESEIQTLYKLDFNNEP